MVSALDSTSSGTVWSPDGGPAVFLVSQCLSLSGGGGGVYFTNCWMGV